MEWFVLIAILAYCDNSPLITNPDMCINEIKQCKMDDIYTVEECILEYEDLILNGQSQSYED